MARSRWRQLVWTVVFLLGIPSSSPGLTGQEVLATTGIRAGLCVQLECTDPSLAMELAASGSMVVQGLVRAEQQLIEARRQVRRIGTFTMSVEPGGCHVAAGASLQFAATVYNEYGEALDPQPSIAWTADGGGSIGASDGLFAATTTPSSPHTVTAQAVIGGQTVKATAAVAVVAGTPGLHYDYYETAALSSLPSFAGLQVTSEGTVANLDLSPRTRDDNFALRFSGRISIAVPGTYTWYLSSDDGSRLLLDGRVTVDNDGMHGAGDKTGTAFLAAGSHEIVVEYFERGGGESLRLQYEGPGIARQSVPDAVLWHASGEVPALSAPGGGSPMLYGAVSIERVASYQTLPYADDLVNLLVVDLDELGSAAPADDELMRVVAPYGVAYVKKGGSWSARDKGLPQGMDEWFDHDRDADGNPVSTDTRIAPSTSVRFYAGPHESVIGERCGMRLAAGRAFYVYHRFGILAEAEPASRNAIVCRDASNGTHLWTREFPQIRGEASVPYKHAFLTHGDAVYTQLEVDSPMVKLDAATGETVLVFANGVRPHAIADRWTEKFHYMARYHEGVLYQAYGSRLVALDAVTGSVRWEHAAAPGKTVVAIAVADSEGKLVAVEAAKQYGIRGSYAGEMGSFVGLDLQSGDIAWTNGDFEGTGSINRLFVSKGLVPVYLWDETAKSKFGLALRAADGTVAWTTPAESPASHGHYSVGMAVDSIFYYGSFGGKAHNLTTGQQLRNWSISHNDGCHELRATPDYMFHGASFCKPMASRQGSWCPISVMGTQCDEGVWPGYGKLYSGPQGCGCMNFLGGFMAISSEGHWPETPDNERLETGSAQAPAAQTGAWPKANEWPVYMGNPKRSSATAHTLADSLSLNWQNAVASIPQGSVGEDWRMDEYSPGAVSAPTVAEGKVFVAVPFSHEVRALDAGSGRTVWSYAAGGLVEQPPIVYQGLCLFGSRDGWVYCLRADSGELLWRFLAAYNGKRIGRSSQLSSPWPVASVLVHEGGLYVNAGMHSNIDKGIQFYKLDPRTGALLWKTRYIAREPQVFDNDVKPSGPTISSYQARPYSRYADLLVVGQGIVGHHADSLAESGGQATYAFRPDASARVNKGLWVCGAFNGIRSKRVQSSGRFDNGGLSYGGFYALKLAFDNSNMYAWQGKSDVLAFGMNPDGSVKYASMNYDSLKASAQWISSELASRWGPCATAMALTTNNVVVAERSVIRIGSRADGKLQKELPVYGGTPVENGVAVAYGRIYVSTRSGHVLCYGDGAPIEPMVSVRGTGLEERTMAAGAGLAPVVKPSNYRWSDPKVVRSRFGATKPSIVPSAAGQVPAHTALAQDNGPRAAARIIDKKREPSNGAGLPARGILREVWAGIDGDHLADWLGEEETVVGAEPSTRSVLKAASIGPDASDNYGERLSGYLEPPVSGRYRFWLAADEEAELRISTDDGAEGLQLVAAVSGAVAPGEWDLYEEQSSGTLELQSGMVYYFEVLHKEGSGEDHCAVAWQIPEQERTVLTADYVRPYRAAGDTRSNDDAVRNVSTCVEACEHD